MPKHLSPEVRYLITGMLAVDPVKRLSVPQIIAHSWTNTNRPPYLRVMQRQLDGTTPIDSLSSLLVSNPSVEDDDDFVPELGVLDEVILGELAEKLGVEEVGVRAALELEGDNAIKVAYKLFQDRKTTQREQASRQ